MLNRQWLRTFSTLCELGSFTRCAERLDMTQAAVSQHVQHLERTLGPLFIRRPRQLELTPTGIALKAHCADLDAADERLQRRLADGASLSGEVSIITPGSIGLALYPRLLDLQVARPSLVIRHRFAPDGEVWEAVLDRRFELGISSRRPEDERLVATPFIDEPLELVVPSSSSVHSWDDLRSLGFIDHPDGQAMAARLLARQFPGSPGVRDLPVRGFINQIGLILEPVARGLGFTVLPRYARQAFGRQADIKAIEGASPIIDTLHFVHRAEWPLSARARFAIDRLLSHGEV